MKAPLAALLFLTVSTAAAQTAAQLTNPAPKDWLHYSGTYDSQRHSLLDQINTGNVSKLQAKWVHHMAGVVDLEAVPIVVDGIMYVSTWNRIDALDGRTGRLIWQYRRDPPTKGWQRGVAIYDGKVYMGTADSYLVALDARTGNILWETKSYEGKRFQGGAPLVAKGKVIMGGRGQAGGFIHAYDANSGEFIWEWNVIPKPGEPGNETWEGDSWKLGGGPVWVSGSFDPELNMIFWGTGQPAVDFIGEVRKGDNLYTDCIVALDIDTGEMKWYFQNTPHDVHDWDSNEMPVLVDAEFDGQLRKLLVQANRNGYYYVLDRTNGKFLHGIPFVSKLTWSSGLTEDGRPIQLPGHEPTVQGNIVCPSTAGATNWPSPAYNPQTRYFYLIAQEGCGINYKASENYDPFAPGARGSGTGYMESPLQQESWQLYVRALELTTGKLAWEFKQIGSKHYGPGVLSTAGGLLFAPEQQGQFNAHDARTGKVLWNFNTGGLVTAGPMSYEIGGRQYIAIPSFSNVLAFGLPDE